MSPLRGIFLKLCSVALFVAMASLVKATSDTVPPGQAVFFRSFFAMPVVFGWLLVQGQTLSGLKANNPWAHVRRGFVGTMAMSLTFTGLGLLPLPEVMAIGYAKPLFVVIFAAILLKENVRAFRLTCVMTGLIGVLIVMWPRLTVGSDILSDQAAVGALVVLAAAACGGLAHTFIRMMVSTESTTAIVFWFSLTSTTLSLLTLPFGWVWPSGWYVFMLIAAGLTGGVAQLLLTAAYRQADASVIAPFDYAAMLIAIAVGYFIFAEVPTLVMLAGASLIMASGIAIIWRERVLGLRREQERQAMKPM